MYKRILVLLLLCVSVFFSSCSSKKRSTSYNSGDYIILPDTEKTYSEKISYEKNLMLKGKEVTVLVEGRSKTDESMLTGRTEGGKIVNFKGDDKCIGSFAKLKITDVKTWSLTGEII